MRPSKPAPPKSLGKYVVGAKIGGGGMATVYLGQAPVEGAEGASHDGVVALKVIRDELAHDEQFASMFVDEAKILARLSHPNVIRTLEYGVSGQHRFIAMELLSGRTYSDVWDTLVHRNEPMPLPLGAWICARTAAGLHSAHELLDESGTPLSVIHRDVNPTNIFLTHGGVVKLIDFGLAKARVRVSKSADGIVKGKIPYLAPEQARGKPIDRRIDVYALGTTLWETATMKRLFKRDTDVDTLKAIRDAHVPDPRETIPGFPDTLWQIIQKALQQDPDGRYQTADEMREALDAFVAETVADPKTLETELSEMLVRLFPGQEEEQAKWLRSAASVRIPARTMAPPAPVPIASSSMLEVSPADDSSSDDEPPPSPVPAPDPQAEAEPAAKPAAKAKSKRSAKKRKSGSPSTTRKKSKKQRARDGRPPRDTDRAEASSVSPPPEENKSRLWLTVGVAVAILLIVALAMSSR